ncbi:MAG: hypothetical protein LBQ00_06890 [Syntrophobacterales bacterium]|jgi:hypothetical protein|nr:hypothetical protein [Syntrophobacterales bacterium]
MKEIIEFIHEPDQLDNLKATYVRMSKERREETILAITDTKEGGAGKFLVSVLPSEPDKEVQKLIRKQIFKLKTMGIKIEEERPAGESALKKIETKRQHKGFMFNYDSTGTRTVIAAFEVKRNGFIFINAVIHLADGLIDLKLAPLTGDDVETIMAKYRTETTKSTVLAETSPRYAAYLIEEGNAISHLYTEDVTQLRRFVSSLKDSIEKPQDIYGLKIPGTFEPLPPGAVLLDDMFTSLTLSWDTIEEDRRAIETFDKPAILLPSHMVREKEESFVKTLIEKEVLKSKITLLRRVFEDYAYIFFQIERFDCFHDLLHLLTSDRGLTEALSFFAKKSLIAPDPEEERRQSSLIVSPYEQIHS